MPFTSGSHTGSDQGPFGRFAVMTKFPPQPTHVLRM